eukprot:TRINITY_DN4859_c0_g1_i1.p1 TRINITY_DN4859_c0_g1~~TRINITY_DN4859_c0_g1_i1.p1  ORF type:complete len:1052 (-),score=318.18 TRINITY_DN4859_c0_g1_i1:104-3259(-)
MARIKKRFNLDDNFGENVNEDELAQLQEEKDAMERELGEARQKLDKARFTLKQSEISMKSLRKENACLKEDLTKFETRVADTEAEHRKLSKESKKLQHAVTELEEAKAELQQQLNSATAKLRDAQEQLIKSADECQEEKEQLDKLERELMKLRSTSGAAESRLRDQLDRVFREKAELEKALGAEKTRQRAAPESEGASGGRGGGGGKQLQALKAELEEATGRLAEERTAAEQLRTENADLQAKVQELTQNVDHLHTAGKGQEQLDRQSAIQKLREDIKAGEDTCIAANAKWQEEHKAAQQLRLELEELKEARAEDQQKVGDVVAATRKQCEKEHRDLQDEHAKLLLQRDYIAKHIVKLRATVRALRATTIANAKKLLDSQRKLTLQIFSASVQSLHRALTKTYARTADALRKYNKEVHKNRMLYNQLQDMKGSIRVYARVRPLSAEEIGGGASMYITFPDDEKMCVTDKGVKKLFEFDRIFNTTSTQTDVFLDTAPLISSVTDGYNVCIFAYGQTGSGKTYTMEGPPHDRGVNFNALIELFRVVRERVQDFSTEILVSLVEIYNETVRDLLSSLSSDPNKPEKLDIKQGEHGMYVPGLVSVPVSCVEDVARIMQTGSRNRATSATNANLHSSRSHALVMVEIVSKNVVTHEVVRGKLTLVDLAGSERVSKSGATDERLLEAQNINRSLSALGDVIQGLVRKDQHIPFRNSKLTYLLQDSLGGDSKTLMFVQVNPHPESSNETVCSLNFASRVKNVELGPAKAHVSDGGGGGASAAELSRCKAKVRLLEEQLQQLQASATVVKLGEDDEDATQVLKGCKLDYVEEPDSLLADADSAPTLLPPVPEQQTTEATPDPPKSLPLSAPAAVTAPGVRSPLPKPKLSRSPTPLTPELAPELATTPKTADPTPKPADTPKPAATASPVATPKAVPHAVKPAAVRAKAAPAAKATATATGATASAPAKAVVKKTTTITAASKSTSPRTATPTGTPKSASPRLATPASPKRAGTPSTLGTPATLTTVKRVASVAASPVRRAATPTKPATPDTVHRKVVAT